jgi:hypothetical protein
MTGFVGVNGTSACTCTRKDVINKDGLKSACTCTTKDVIRKDGLKVPALALQKM